MTGILPWLIDKSGSTDFDYAQFTERKGCGLSVAKARIRQKQTFQEFYQSSRVKQGEAQLPETVQ
jgi:hypothetical protein